MILWIILGTVVLLVFWGVSTYNFFVTAKTRVNASVQEIGNQLKRQSDLIPNLVESTKGYLKHEKQIFTDLTEARKAVANALRSGNVQKMSEAGSKLASVVPSLQVAVESNPEIKGSLVVTEMMDELRDTADKIMYARRLVIDLTADYNVRRVTFPSSLVANMLNIEELPGLITPNEEEFMKVSGPETKTPKVSL